MIVTIYRVQAYQVLILNPIWPPKIQDGRHEIQLFDISTSDAGDFPRIIEIVLLDLYSFFWEQISFFKNWLKFSTSIII